MADFGSESVAAFRRNGWPTCVGISGRLGLEYAHLAACITLEEHRSKSALKREVLCLRQTVLDKTPATEK